jgi:hypothetical protein
LREREREREREKSSSSKVLQELKFSISEKDENSNTPIGKVACDITRSDNRETRKCLNNLSTVMSSLEYIGVVSNDHAVGVLALGRIEDRRKTFLYRMMNNDFSQAFR